MRLERVELVQVAVPLAAPFRTGVSALSHCDSLLVRVDGGGVTGWGEVVADTRPSYAPETLVTARHVLTDFLIPAVVGKDFAKVEDAVAQWAWVRGHPMAKAGLELALWDWWGRATGKSVSELLGGTRARVEVGVSVGVAEWTELKAMLERFQREGYARFKLKVTPRWLDKPLIAALVALGPSPQLAVDANGTFQPEDTPLLRKLKGLQFVEQPLAWDDLVQHAALRKAGGPPVCLDESIGSLAALESALALEALDVLNVKPGRVGGLLAAKACLERAHAAGVETFVGGMLETAIGRAGNVALASLSTVTLPSDLSASNRYFAQDLATPFVLGPQSTLAVPTGPGLGVEVDEAAVRRFER
ncbi:MAG: o-succinylbenzoate synthase [Myxococcota bacterium]